MKNNLPTKHLKISFCLKFVKIRKVPIQYYLYCGFLFDNAGHVVSSSSIVTEQYRHKKYDIHMLKYTRFFAEFSLVGFFQPMCMRKFKGCSLGKKLTNLV